MANCLVLGANGFIGSPLVNSLAIKGHQVRCFDRFKTNLTNFEADSPNIEIFRGDFMNASSIEEALTGIDYVFHFISMTNPRTAENDPLVDIRTNLSMSVQLFDLSVKSSVKKIIFASTGGAIYGDNPVPKLNEDQRTLPVSPYAINKLAIENYLAYFKRKHGLDYQVLRISNPYGPGQNTLSGQGVISIFLENALNNRPITIYGDGSMIRDYLYIDDLTSAITDIFDKDSQNNIYNVGSGNGVSVNELVRLISQVTGLDPEIIHKPKPSSFIDRVVLDTTRLEKEFGFAAKISLEDGIRKTWQSLKTKQ